MISVETQGLKGMHEGGESGPGGSTIGATNVTGDHYAATRLAHATAHATRSLTRTSGKCDSREKDEEHDMTVQLKMAVQVSSGCQVSVRGGRRENERRR